MPVCFPDPELLKDKLLSVIIGRVLIHFNILPSSIISKVINEM